jgi:hypothetical protein
LSLDWFGFCELLQQIFGSSGADAFCEDDDVLRWSINANRWCAAYVAIPSNVIILMQCNLASDYISETLLDLTQLTLLLICRHKN